MMQNKPLIILKRVLCLVLGYDQQVVNDLLFKYDRLAHSWVTQEGKRNAVKRLKVVYTLCVSKRFESEYFKQEDWVSVCDRGYPKSVGFLVRYITGSPRDMRLAFSILRAYTLFVLSPSYDVSTIVEPGRGTMSYSQERIKRCFKRFAGEWEFPAFRVPPFKWYVSSKAGPNGIIAYQEWPENLFALNADYTVKMWITMLWYELGWHRSAPFKKLLRFGFLSQYKLRRFRNPNVRHSALHFLSEGGGKTRVIAIGDIFSQTCLKPFHDQLMSMLRKIPSDGTFDQGQQVRRVLRASAQGKKIHCFDLSACTDRFPVKFQHDVIKHCFGSRLAGLWRNVLTRRSFSNPNLQTKVSYTVGQPMGFLSSWAAMALSHHMVVWVCADKAGVNLNFKDPEYALLGDDIVIWDTKVAEEYLRFMTSTLGVDISMSKSIVSKVGGEFAKVLCWKGENVSPIPLKLCVAVSKFPNLLPMFVKDLKRFTGERFDVYQLIKLVPRNKYNLMITLLSCPLYSKSTLWGVTEAQVWAYIKECQYDSKDLSSIVTESQKDYDSLGLRGHFGGVTTPPGDRLSSIVHPLVIERNLEAFQLKAGDNFIMSNPGTSFEEWFHLSTLNKEFTHESKRIQKYIILTRLILKASRHFDIFWTDYLVWTDRDLRCL